MLAALVVGAIASEAIADAPPLQFRFRLDNDYSTSAGAFDASGALVRTLWSNRRYDAGFHDATWDGRDDDGRAVPADADYEIRVLTHNVIYTWDGVIGNTSSDTTSPVHHDAPYFLAGLAVSGDRAYFTTPTEGANASMRYFRLDEPQSWRALPALPMAYGATMGLVAADRERVYWAHDSSPWPHTWGKGGDQAFVMATDRDLSREIVFEAGAPTCVLRAGQICYRDGETDQNIRSAIDVVREVPENPATQILEGARNDVTGLAVQEDGPLLFIAHGALTPARIHVLDKRTGRELARIPLAGVGRLVAVPGRDELWAIHDDAKGRVVSHLAIGPAPGFAVKMLRTLSGVDSPLALDLTPDGAQIAVAEGGARQQVRAFDTATGALVWELGEPGGYAAHGPLVSTDKFSFRRQQPDPHSGQRLEHALLSFAPDGSLWTGDTGLSRIVRFGPDRRYRDQIAFLPNLYGMVVDRNDASRVFAEYMEFAVDYDKPIDRSWRLTRYFADSPVLTPKHHGFANGFIDVATLSNGRTYGLLRAPNGVEVVEIPDSGDLKRFDLRLRQPVFLDKAGNLHAARAGSNGRAEFWRRPLEGFDADGAPSWGHEEIVARVARDGRDPRVNALGNTLERSVAEIDPHLQILFDTSNSTPDQFHLAAVEEGTSRWRWRASPASGEFDLAQPDGVFDNSRPWYAGMAVTALGNQIVYNYHGEGWHGEGQANQFLHWYRDGLFVGQFGVPALRGIPPAAAGMAGNALSIQLAAANGATYLWHNDEHVHAGVHRWHLDGVDRIRELTGRARPGGPQIALANAGQSLPHDAQTPAALTARAAVSGVQLAWRLPADGANAIEVQRLQPTYVGSRFERIATLAGNAVSFVDSQPLHGEPTVYRVRGLFGDGTSDYSNHVHFTAPAHEVVLESQSFETAPGDLRDEFHPSPSPDVDVSVIADPANPRNRVLHVRARRPAGATDFRARVRWPASTQLFNALNESVGRPRGSRPDIYRVKLALRFLQAKVSAGSEVALQVDPGYNLFSTPGRRHSLLPAGDSQQVSFTFAALPNGGGARGLQQYRAEPPSWLAVAFPIDLRGDGDVVEFLVDDLSISRLDAPGKASP